MGKRGTNQARFLNLSGPCSIGFGQIASRAPGSRHQDGALRHAAPGVRASVRPEYALIGDGDDDPRAPYEGGGVSGENAIRGAHGTTTFIRDIETSKVFLCDGMGGEYLGSEGPYHQIKIGTDEGNGRILELKEERRPRSGQLDLRRGDNHHHAFDVIDGDNQMTVREHLVGSSDSRTSRA